MIDRELNTYNRCYVTAAQDRSEPSVAYPYAFSSMLLFHPASHNLFWLWARR